MPVHLEMYLSHTGASLFDYPPFVENRFSFVNNYEDDDYIRSLYFSRNHILISKDPKGPHYFEKKKAFESCDIEEDLKTSNKKNYNNCTDSARKKKVTFADDKGFSLVEVREIPGLPTWASMPLTPLMGDTKSSALVEKKWKVAFEQPSCTNNKFKELLEINKVVLESVNIKTDGMLEGTVKVKCFDLQPDVLKSEHLNDTPDDMLEGTVKVKNLAYEKNVFVRISFDRWLSSTDVKATYIQPPKISEKSEEFDYFSFNINIPSSSLKYEVIEFCIGFQCNGGEYWDNNRGINYRLTTEIVKRNAIKVNHLNKHKLSNDKITISLTENMEKFSEIDSWNNFMHNQPYW